ncbi:hypothetical protein M431DRAFT_293240 [Trichoderma harzianum CBS 226.95]|uniref:Uncharacterized protein n=1 Tax=Trichoderma harzianum CBS 226.95 TaxID=983964 RepID=A0A2T4APR9_TRIHA|nr:hypothetical protein M431DRAFT_293240 [Trichoderma harzianum CBS 226.95]PTB59020.1 hypothetical protein M431DRAFT_293240 [Trichoderma harzianum CBS 226.95]
MYMDQMATCVCLYKLIKCRPSLERDSMSSVIRPRTRPALRPLVMALLVTTCIVKCHPSPTDLHERPGNQPCNKP